MLRIKNMTKTEILKNINLNKKQNFEKFIGDINKHKRGDWYEIDGIKVIYSLKHREFRIKKDNSYAVAQKERRILNRLCNKLELYGE
jgi:hypothetical protein